MSQAPTPTPAVNRGGRPRRVREATEHVPTPPAPAEARPLAGARILRLPLVLDRVGLSRAAIYAKAARGEFPPPVKLGPRAAGWLESEIEAWIAARVAEHRA